MIETLRYIGYFAWAGVFVGGYYIAGCQSIHSDANPKEAPMFQTEIECSLP